MHAGQCAGRPRDGPAALRPPLSRGLRGGTTGLAPSGGPRGQPAHPPAHIRKLGLGEEGDFVGEPEMGG